MKRRRRVNPFEAVDPKLPAVLKPIANLLNDKDVEYTLIGGMGMAFHFPSYPTDDIDIAVRSTDGIPDLSILDLKRKSPNRYEDRKYGIEIDFVTSNFINIPQKVMDYAIESTQAYVDTSYGTLLRVANPLAIFAIKLCRYRTKDKAHLLWMMRHAYIPREDSLVEIGVPEDVVTNRMVELFKEHRQEEEEEGKMGW